MSDADCTPGREPRNVAASKLDFLLPPPRRLCFRHCLSVCLLQLCTKTSKQICMKYSGKVGNGSVNKWLNFGRNSD